MSTPALLRREIRALVFDQYGTVVDMQTGLTEAVTPFLAAKGWEGSAHQFVTWWRRTHFENSMSDALCARGHIDCIGAKSWGMRTAFIDRRRRPFGQTPHQPDIIVADFAELAEVMAG